MLQYIMRGRILDIKVSSTSDDVILTSSDVAENEDSLFYSNVNISSKADVTDDVMDAQVCFTATDVFG